MQNTPGEREGKDGEVRRGGIGIDVVNGEGVGDEEKGGRKEKRKDEGKES